MDLLSKELLVKTGPVDYADWNFTFLLGVVQRLRFQLALNLLPDQSERLLEIGYGSGVFLPVLAKRTGHLHGVDIHPRADRVREALSKVGVSVTLQQASAEALPYANQTFNHIVAISALEFVEDLPMACSEVKRILKPGGKFVVVMPGHSAFVDLGFRLLTGKRAEEDFGQRRQSVITTLTTHFQVRKRIVAPPLLGTLMPLYVALSLI